jgi:hypothetical protein
MRTGQGQQSISRKDKIRILGPIIEESCLDKDADRSGIYGAQDFARMLQGLRQDTVAIPVTAVYILWPVQVLQQSHSILQATLHLSQLS